MKIRFVEDKVPLALGIFALAVILRLIYLAEIKQMPFFDHPIMDASYHDTWARKVAQGELIGKEPFFRAPLYPYLLGLVYKLSRGSYVLPRLIQFLYGGATSVLVFLLAYKYGGRIAGIFAGIACASYPVLIYYDGELLTESLFTFLSTSSIYLLSKAIKGKLKPIFISGLLLGLAMITRPTIGLFLPFALLGIILLCHRRSLASILLLTGIAIPIAPVTIHNYLVSGEFIPIVWQAGLNIYLGNNPDANGWSATSGELRKDWWGGYKDMIEIPRRELGRKPRYSEVSSYWTRKAIAYIRDNPADWIRLMLKKAALFWGRLEFPNNQDYNFMRLRSNALRNQVFNFSTIAPLALLGLLLGIRNRNLYFVNTFVVTYFIGTIAFFVCARYRIPIVPTLCILAGYSVSRLVSFFSFREWRNLLPSLTALLGFAMIVNLNLSGEKLPGYAQSYTGVSKVLIEKNDYAGAMEMLEKAIEENPQWAEAYEQMAIVNLKFERVDQAEANLRMAIKVMPQAASAYRTLGMILISKDRIQEAREVLDQALRLAPFLEDVHNLLGVVERNKGNIQEAENFFRREVEINPGNWRAWANLGNLLEQKGDLEGAIKAYSEAHRLNPGEVQIGIALSKALIEAGRNQEAEEISSKLAGRSVESLKLRYNQAVVLQNSGRLEEAKRIYEEILSANPNHEASLVNLGVIYAKLGMEDNARFLWEKVLSLNPSNQTAKRNLDLLDR
ncbi:MAG: tetratricopeptide repeat protein [bacterium]